MKSISILVLVVLGNNCVCEEREREKMWTCTIEYHNKTHSFTVDESKAIKAMFDDHEKMVVVGTTDRKENIPTEPQCVFLFLKDGAETIRYLVFIGETPFQIEVATGKNKTRRIFGGDKALKSKIQEIIDKTFAKK